MEYRFNENNFTDEVIKSDVPVMIDFYAEWCGPCRMMSPVVEEFAKDFEGRVKIGKINVDEESELAMRFGVQSIPSFVFIKDGKVVELRLHQGRQGRRQGNWRNAEADFKKLPGRSRGRLKTYKQPLPAKSKILRN